MAAMFEDVARNLAVPKAKGMTTTLVTTKAGRLDHREAHDRAISDAADVADFVTDDLSEFLARLNSNLTDQPPTPEAPGRLYDPKSLPIANEQLHGVASRRPRTISNRDSRTLGTRLQTLRRIASVAQQAPDRQERLFAPRQELVYGPPTPAKMRAYITSQAKAMP